MATRSENQEHQRIGVRIRELRKSAGVSQTKLGNALGVSFQQIQKYETGQNRIAAERLQQIAGVLGADVLEFYGTTGSPAGMRSEAERDGAVHARSEVDRARGGFDFSDAFDRIKDPRARYLLAELARVFSEIEQR